MDHTTALKARKATKKMALNGPSVYLQGKTKYRNVLGLHHSPPSPSMPPWDPYVDSTWIRSLLPNWESKTAKKTGGKFLVGSIFGEKKGRGWGLNTKRSWQGDTRSKQNWLNNWTSWCKWGEVNGSYIWVVVWIVFCWIKMFGGNWQNFQKLKKNKIWFQRLQSFSKDYLFHFISWTKKQNPAVKWFSPNPCCSFWKEKNNLHY